MRNREEALAAALYEAECYGIGATSDTNQRVILRAAKEVQQLRVFANWIDTWISNPARAYSHDALEGLFGMTRDRLAELQERTCQKCGRPTRSEEALVDGQIWCHPCADVL